MEIYNDQIAAICTQLLHCDRNLAARAISRHRAAVFGLKLKICIYLWYHLEGLLPIGATPKHMF